MAREVVIRGRVFKSMQAAAVALGVSRQTIAKAHAAGRLDYIGRRYGSPVLIRGVAYPSTAEAARRLGVSRASVIRALDCGRPDDVGRLGEVRKALKGD